MQKAAVPSAPINWSLLCTSSSSQHSAELRVSVGLLRCCDKSLYRGGGQDKGTTVE